MQQGGHNSKSVCMSTVSCAFFISVTVSQCCSVAEEGVQGVYSLQLVKGLLLTVDSGRGRGVYSKKSTVKSTVGQGGSKGSTVEKSTVVSGIPFTVDCRL